MADFTAGDAINGGSGFDELRVDGAYGAGVNFTASTLVNVERITLAAGNNYSLTTHNATITGDVLAIDGSALGSTNRLTVNGAAKTNGRFDLTGGAGNDAFAGGAGADTFRIHLGGNDSLIGGLGADVTLVHPARAGQGHSRTVVFIHYLFARLQRARAVPTSDQITARSRRRNWRVN